MFRKVVDELKGINELLGDLAVGLRLLSERPDDTSQYDGIRSRLDALEGPLQAKIGEVEGLLAKAEGLKNAARAAEERARGSLERQERLAAERELGDEDEPPHVSDEDVAFIREGDALRGHENGMFPVRSSVERLTAHKFQAGG